MSGGDSAFTPHERPISRVRTMYRIPTAPNSNRTLELYHTREPILADYAWPGACSISCKLDHELPLSVIDSPPRVGDAPRYANPLAPLPFADESFDLVILHRTLDELAASSQKLGLAFNGQAFLERVSRVLVPGGVVTGCADNRTGLKYMSRQIRHRFSGIGPAAGTPPFTLRRLERLLTTPEFADVRIFTLLDNCDNPLRLVDIDPVTSKTAFRREIEIARDSWSRLGYVGRRIAVEIGSYPYLEESFYFWAYKRC